MAALALVMIGSATLQLPPLDAPAGASAQPPPGPGGHAGFADDFVLFGLNSTPDPHAAFHGHANEIPTPVTAPGAWSWTDGIVAVDPDTKAGDVAWAREGYAVSVWTSDAIGGAVICDQTSDPGDEFPSPQRIGNIYGSRWNGTGWESPVVLVAGVLDIWYPGVTIAFDPSGKFVLGYFEAEELRGVGFNGECEGPKELRVKGAAYWGNNLTVVPGTTTLLDVSSPLPFIGQYTLTSTMLPQLAPAGLITTHRAMVSWMLPTYCLTPPNPFYHRLRHGHWDGDSFDPTLTYPVVNWMYTSRQIEAASDKIGDAVVVWGGVDDDNGDPCDAFGGGTAELWHARHDFTGWASALALDPLTDQMPDPAISFPYDDTGVVVYSDDQEADGSDIWALTWHDGTATSLGKIDTGGMSPRIASDHFDRTLAAWFDSNAGEMQYRTFDGSTWSTAGAVPGIQSLFAAAAHSGSPSTTLAEWSFYDYVCEDTFKLGDFGTIDIGEAGVVGSTSEVNFVAFIDENSSTLPAPPTQNRLYYVKRGTNAARADYPVAPASTVNMGAPATLTQFLTWAYEMYPANHTYLDIEDHGGATEGVCWDAMGTYGPTQRGDDDQIELPELRTGLADALGAARLDVVGFDACCMANFETAYEIRNQADYMDASENTEAGPGWDYRYVMENLTDPWQRTPKNVTEVVFQAFVSLYGPLAVADAMETFSAIDLGRVRTGPLATDVSELGAALAAALPAQYPAINGSVWNSSWTDCACDGGTHIDLRNLSKEFISRVPDPAVVANATQVRDEVPNVAWKSFVDPMADWPANWSSEFGSDYHGLSIKVVLDGWNASYNATQFALDSAWDDFLWEYYLGYGAAIPESGWLAATVAVGTSVGIALFRSRRRHQRAGRKSP